MRITVAERTREGDAADGIKRRILYDLRREVMGLPVGQRRALLALVGSGRARTYREAALMAGVSLGTLLTHMNRVRERHPQLYEAVRAVRGMQLAQRHAVALEAARVHTRTWFRKQANRRYHRQYGYWPWERPRRSKSMVGYGP